jgi:hypothetical protein
MSRASLVKEINAVLRSDYGMEQTIEDPITVRDLALIVQALKQGKVREHKGPTIITGSPKSRFR